MPVSYRMRGLAPHLPWFLRRLEVQGLAAARCDDAASRLPAGWTGLELDGCWLDLAQDGDHPLAARAEYCRHAGIECIELAGNWPAPGAEHGFMLLVGQAPLPDSAAWQVLDALAPQPGCWLHCGPLHSARFCQRVFDALLHAGRSGLDLPETQPRALQWERLLSEQWQLADKLRQLAAAYLAERVGLAPPYPSPLPAAAQHYAAALARGIALTLPQQQDWEGLLKQLSELLRAERPQP
ncbi:hypothetical protein [Chromobacterium alticapitis]|uniref:DUF4123 domain-containing protein n=1 Tax=Chromobacterium alticapitis TaxID=2073169 RepID=A0A2S5DGT4_9NEIS|nr:hypothetical protein [Chromobacterium alticapitis]POZ62254.1 hypothetical protein C2I19_08780 [Chromobacterium alticapitis]